MEWLALVFAAIAIGAAWFASRAKEDARFFYEATRRHAAAAQSQHSGIAIVEDPDGSVHRVDGTGKPS